MRLPQLLLPLLITLWLYLGAVGWVMAALILRREPRLALLLLGLVVGLAAGLAPAAAGQQGAAGFLASFPLALAASFAVCAAAGMRLRP